MLLRDPGPGLAIRDSAAYAPAGGLDAPRGLLPAEIDGAPVLLVPGRYGREVEAFPLDAAGGLGAQVALHLTGDDGAPAAMLALARAAVGGCDL